MPKKEGVKKNSISVNMDIDRDIDINKEVKNIIGKYFKETTFESIFNRRSIRKYQDKKIEWEKIGLIIEAARYSPSSGNLQNWRFIIVTNQETKNAIADYSVGQLWIAKAPVLIIVIGLEKNVRRHYGLRGERLYAIQNCAMAAQNIMLAAHALGLSSCFVGAFDEEGVRSILNIPKEARPQGIITLGYGDEKVEAPNRYSLEDITFLEFYHEPTGKIKDKEALKGYRWARLVTNIITKLEEFKKINIKLKQSKDKHKQNIINKIKTIFK